MMTACPLLIDLGGYPLIRAGLCKRKAVGYVRVNRNDEPVVVRKLQRGKRRLGGIRSVGAHHQETVLIVSAGGSHRVNERLVQVVYYGPALVVAAVPLVVGVLPARFVHALENEVLVVILEIFRDLSPAARQLRGYLLFLVGVWLVPILVVHVQDNVHIQVVCVINYLLNAAHPVGAYRAVVAYLALPRGGYAYRVESRVLHCLYEFRSYRGIAPARFLRKPGTAVSSVSNSLAEPPSETVPSVFPVSPVFPEFSADLEQPAPVTHNAAAIKAAASFLKFIVFSLQRACALFLNVQSYYIIFC